MSRATIIWENCHCDLSQKYFMKYISSMFLLLRSSNRIVLSLKINQFHSFCHGYSFLLKISFFLDYSNDLTRGYSKISPDDAKEVHDVVTKGGDETYFQEPDFLENPVPPLFKCGHLLLPFQTVLETIGGTVESRRYCHIGEPSKGASRKDRILSQPERGGRSRT